MYLPYVGRFWSMTALIQSKWPWDIIQGHRWPRDSIYDIGLLFWDSRPLLDLHLTPFTRYNDLLAKKCGIFIPALYLRERYHYYSIIPFVSTQQILSNWDVAVCQTVAVNRRQQIVSNCNAVIPATLALYLAATWRQQRRCFSPKQTTILRRPR